MLEIIKRCKHCGTEYIYQASGYGCHDQYNDKEYCPDCKEAIVRALDKQPVKYIQDFMEIDNKNLVKELLEIKNDIVLPKIAVAIACELYYDKIELYEYQSKSYALCKNNNSDELHLFILQEFDCLNKKFTDKAWYNGHPHEYKSYSKGYNLVKPLKATELTENKLSEPFGKIFFNG